MPQLHYYHVQCPPFNEINPYPGMHRGKYYGRAELLTTLGESYDFQRIKRPHLCGEFGLYQRHGDPTAQAAILDDELAIFEELGFHWTIWSYKDLGMMGIVYPKDNTPWKQFTASKPIAALRETYAECADSFAASLTGKIALMTLEDIAHFKQQIGHHWHSVALRRALEHLQSKHADELEAMARSWAFDNCEIHKLKFDVVRKHLPRPLHPEG
jgi:hypothetical protein